MKAVVLRLKTSKVRLSCSKDRGKSETRYAGQVIRIFLGYELGPYKTYLVGRTLQYRNKKVNRGIRPR